MHNFTKLRQKAEQAYGGHNTRSAASSTQVIALLEALETASALLDDLTARNVTSPGIDVPPPPQYRSAADIWRLGETLRVRLDRVQHLSEVTR